MFELHVFLGISISFHLFYFFKINIYVVFSMPLQLTDSSFFSAKIDSGQNGLFLFFGIVILVFVFVMLLVAWRAVRRDKSADVSGLYLLQIYASLIMLFTAAYFIALLLASAGSYRFVSGGQSDLVVDGSISFFRAFWQLFYFAVVVATSTGYGDMYSLYPSTRMVSMVHALVR